MYKMPLGNTVQFAFVHVCQINTTGIKEIEKLSTGVS